MTSGPTVHPHQGDHRGQGQSPLDPEVGARRAQVLAVSADCEEGQGAGTGGQQENDPAPADAQEIVSPLGSVMVTIVLLKVALMWAIPRVTPLRSFFFGAGLPPAPVFACSAILIGPLSVVRCQLQQSRIAVLNNGQRTRDN